MKLRIISGKYGGRMINAPSGHKTHPMSEKIRGAIFNMLGDITGMHVLDAYAGSGALSIESISRGAKSVYAVDNDKHAYQTINENINTLHVTGIKVSRANIRSWLENNPNSKFDLILCDPPYDDIKDDVLSYIAGFLSTEGIVVLSLPALHNDVALTSSFALLSKKTYGDAKIIVFKRKD